MEEEAAEEEMEVATRLEEEQPLPLAVAVEDMNLEVVVPLLAVVLTAAAAVVVTTIRLLVLRQLVSFPRPPVPWPGLAVGVCARKISAADVVLIKTFPFFHIHHLPRLYGGGAADSPSSLFCRYFFHLSVSIFFTFRI